MNEKVTDDERAALVQRLRTTGTTQRELNAADLLEVDGMRLALAEETIADFHIGINWAPYSEGWHLMNRALKDYNAAKEALS
jgi:hypothetical protein